jgi:hypothetical protein
MYKNPDPKTVVYTLLALWPLAIALALINRDLWWIAMYWLPLGVVGVVLVPGIWYIVRYIPNDIRRLIRSRR